MNAARPVAGPRAEDVGARPELSVITASRGRPDLLRSKAAAMARQALEPSTFEWCLWLNEAPAEAERTERMLRDLDLPFPLVSDGGAAHPVGRARNLAAARARGSVLLLSDDDCVHDEGALAAHAAFHRAVPRAVGIGPLRLPESLRDGRLREPFERPAAVAGRASWINMTGANSSVPRDAFEAVGGYDDAWTGYGGEDPELALRLRARGLRFRHVAGADAVHHGRVWDDAEKAYRAGWAHRRVAERHPRSGASWALGVHPWILAAKNVVLHGPWSGAMPEDVLRYERAYARGARDATGREGPKAAPGEENA